MKIRRRKLVTGGAGIAAAATYLPITSELASAQQARKRPGGDLGPNKASQAGLKRPGGDLGPDKAGQAGRKEPDKSKRPPK